MSDREKDVTANLEFFKSAILEPALENEYGFDVEGPVSDFGAVEAAHWAWLGVQIGYFDGKDAQELISSSNGVFRAWSNLQHRQIISPEDRWANVIRIAESGQPALNTGSFSAAEEIGPRTRELLQNTFQTFLLLTAENISDETSRYFLDSIGWTDDREWNARKGGHVHRRSGSVQQVGAGFANVLNYWEEMESSSRSAVNHDAELPYAYDLERGSIGFSEGLTSGTAVPNFVQDARAILSRRFNLSHIDIVDRYFALAGEFANRAGEDSPAWLDARLSLFESLISLITYAGASVEGHQTRLWNSFTSGFQSPLPENELGLWKSPRREKDEEVEPPEESV